MDVSNRNNIKFELVHSEESPLVTVNMFDPSYDMEDPAYQLGSITINKTRSVNFLSQLKVIFQEIIGRFSEFDVHETFNTHMYNDLEGELRLVIPT